RGMGIERGRGGVGERGGGDDAGRQSLSASQFGQGRDGGAGDRGAVAAPDLIVDAERAVQGSTAGQDRRGAGGGVGHQAVGGIGPHQAKIGEGLERQATGGAVRSA